MSTDPKAQRWQALSAHFDRLIDCSAADQEQALSEIAQSDARLAAEVRAMLVADARTMGLLEQREEVLAPIAADATPEFGPCWHVERLLGRGGMGEVWLAQRHQGDVVQTAAVKLLKRGMDSDALLQRFLQERRILARLNHPAIATLLDAGVTSDGRPFLAMDYICGEPLTAYARSAALSLEARLMLMAAIARVVDYAHRQLIVHRDLKPSNVLVDDEGRPHLLDFGIAKVLGDDTDELVLTATGVRVLSPAYAAPEQVRGEDVGVAADVYGLGVLLYEVCVGRLPHRRSGRMEMLAQEITAERATRPSLAAAEIEQQPDVPPLCERLGWSRRLRGDLDTLILKAIHPEPERRYGSAAMLAEDIDHYLAGRPIRARRDSRTYRLRKFISRHRLGVLASVIGLTGLLAGLGVALWQGERAIESARYAEQARAQVEREYQRSEATKDFLVRSLAMAGLHQDGKRLTVDDLMQTMAERVDSELADEPAAQGELRVVIGQSLIELGQVATGLAMVESGREQLTLLYPEPTKLMSLVLNNVALSRRKTGNLVGAEAAIRESSAMLDQLPGDNRLLRLKNRSILDHILALRGRWAESLANTQARLAERRALLGDGDPGLAVDYNNLAVALSRMDRYAEALQAYADCLKLLDQGGLGDSARAAGVERGRAVLLARSGQWDQAHAALAKAAELRQRNLPAGHPDHRDTAFAQAILSRYQGDLEAAQAGFQALLTSADPDDSHAAEYRYELGRTQMLLAHWDVAAATLTQAEKAMDTGTDSPQPLAIHARALAAFARWHGDNDAASADLIVAESFVTLEKSGLGALDEAAEMLLMRSTLAQAEDRASDAAAFRQSALARFQSLGISWPEWIH